jgi:hypothetical protein
LKYSVIKTTGIQGLHIGRSKIIPTKVLESIKGTLAIGTVE